MLRSCKASALALLLVSSVMLSACADRGYGTGGNYDGGNGGFGSKESIGTIGGAGVGALIGNQFGHGNGKIAATVLGGLAGGFIGNRIGADLDEQDRARMQAAQARAYSAPVGQTITWNNPSNGHSGTFTPTRDGRDASGAFCREYTQTILIGGKRQEGVGTACRNPDGSWQIVNGN